MGFQEDSNALGMTVLRKGLEDKLDPRNRTMVRFTGTSGTAVPAIPPYATSNPIGMLTKKTAENTEQAMRNVWGKKTPSLTPKAPSALEWMGPPNLSSSGTNEPPPPALPSMVRPERDMTPMIEARQAYGQQRGDIDERLGKGISELDALRQSYGQSQGSSFGGLMANQQALASINALTPAIAGMQEKGASLVGALPYLNAMGKAGDDSREMQKTYDIGKMKSMFEERSPLTQAQIENYKAQAALHGQQREGSKQDLALKRLQLLSGGKETTGGINPETLLKAQQALQSEQITPKQYDDIVRAAASYKQPALPRMSTGE